MIASSLHAPFSPDAPSLAVLYSGGLDSAVLAALATAHFPPGPLELITVAFANPRVLAAAAAPPKPAKVKKNKRENGEDADEAAVAAPAPTAATKGPYDTPDRLTAHEGLEELRQIDPKREWRLVEVNVRLEEYEGARSEIESTMAPADSVVSYTAEVSL